MPSTAQAGWWPPKKQVPNQAQKTAAVVANKGKETTNPQAMPTDAPTETPTTTENGVEINISSDTLDYIKSANTYVATGHVVVVAQEQGTELHADKMTYLPEKDVVVAEQNVVFWRNGEPTRGAYARIHLGTNSTLITQPNTKVGLIKLSAKEGFVNADYALLKEGHLVLKRDILATQVKNNGAVGGNRASFQYVAGDPKRGVVIRNGFTPYFLNSKQVLQFVDADNRLLPQQEETLDLVHALQEEGETLEAPDFKTQGDGNWKFKVKELEIIQRNNQYQTIDLKWPKVTFKNRTVFTYPGIDFGQDQRSERLDYLGPQLGFNRDLGGLYFDPGFDMRLGRGSLRVSPIATFGRGIKRSSRALDSKNAGIGAGFLATYQNDWLKLLAGRALANNYNVLRGEVKLPFSRATRIIATQNAFGGPNFFTLERPSWGVQVADNRGFALGDHFGFIVNNSVGYYKDDFFPQNSNTRLVNIPTEAVLNGPQTAGRWQVQAAISNARPLVRLGRFAELGATAQVSNALYTTGDNYTVLRAGPSLNVFFKNVFLSQLQYLVGTQIGSTPFVFDRYFLGKQTLVTNNALRLGPYVTVGARLTLNLGQDKASSKLLVGNTLYVTAGPRNFKLTLAYDALFKNTTFGLSYYPSFGDATVPFDRAKVFQPINVGNGYAPVEDPSLLAPQWPTEATPSTVKPTNKPAKKGAWWPFAAKHPVHHNVPHIAQESPATS
jgi:hypothetical protein